MSTEQMASATPMPGLSASQQRIVELLKRGGPSSIAALAGELGLNAETVRHHLRALEALGYAVRTGSRPVGRGRPEVRYGLSAAAERLFPRREGELLRELARHLKETGNESLLEEFFAHYIDARRADALARVEHLGGRERIEEVARIMSELGFMASAESGRERPRLHLCHCPLRELVEVTRVPCRAELGFVRELLGEPLTRLAWIPAGDDTCSYRTKAGT
jgi:predicted ArsR family transcriptional regulator